MSRQHLLAAPALALMLTLPAQATADRRVDVGLDALATPPTLLHADYRRSWIIDAHRGARWEGRQIRERHRHAWRHAHQRGKRHAFGREHHGRFGHSRHDPWFAHPRRHRALVLQHRGFGFRPPGRPPWWRWR